MRNDLELVSSIICEYTTFHPVCIDSYLERMELSVLKITSNSFGDAFFSTISTIKIQDIVTMATVIPR